MAIFDLDDLATYAPDLSLTEGQLLAAIAQIQAIIEGPMGANRPLELTEFVEVKTLAVKLQSAQFSYAPIAVLPAPVIELRAGNTLSFPSSRPLGTTEWVVVEDDGYILDRNGVIRFNRQAIAGAWYPSGGAFMATEARFTYTAGFDFSEDAYPVLSIKGAIANALRYTQSQSSKGIERVQVDGDGSITYATNEAATKLGVGIPGTLPTAMLASFKKYRPRHW